MKTKHVTTTKQMRSKAVSKKTMEGRRTRSKHISFRVRPETFKAFMQGLKAGKFRTKTEYMEKLIMHGVDHV